MQNKLSTLPRLRRFPSDLQAVPYPSVYRDQGCGIFPSCLECPFPLCVTEEVPWGEETLANLLRAKTLALFNRVAGLTPGQLAARFALSARQVQRAFGFAHTQLSDVWRSDSPQRQTRTAGAGHASIDFDILGLAAISLVYLNEPSQADKT